MRPRSHLVTSIVLAAGFGLVWAPIAAAADNANCSVDNTRFSGMAFSQTGVQKHGVAGTIDGQSLNQCLNPVPVVEKSGTTAWSALGDAGGSNTIMQMGTGRCREFLWPDCTWNMEFYWAWGIDPEAPGCSGWARQIPQPLRIAGRDGAAHDYKIYHKDNRWRFYVGVNEKRSLPEGDICWTPTIAWWFSESWDDGDALGGSVGNKLRTKLTNYANVENGQFFWTSFNAANACSFPQGAPRFCDVIDGTTFDTWTNR